jgi:hypothetical protein
MLFLVSILLAAAVSAFGQQTCASIPVWTACDLTVDLQAGESTTRVELRAEFRSPKHKTYLINAFRDGERKFVLRFAPTEVGAWDYKFTSSLARLDGETGQLTATESNAAVFIRNANVHHFATEDRNPHLWMGTAIEPFVSMPRADFDRTLEQRAQEKFTHLRLTIEAKTDLAEAAARIRAINAKGITADIVLGTIPADSRERANYVADMVARFGAFNVTWAGGTDFEKAPKGRSVAKEVGQLIAKLDAYAHVRGTMAEVTSAPTTGDGWVNVLTYGTASADVGAVEHQFYQLPGINAGIRSRQDLWNATMNGQYPSSGSGPQMKAWFEFMSQSRYWELEPYFEVDGGRALALDGVEYLVYVEKPGLVELTVEKHGYDVVWMNPSTGEIVKAKDYNGEHFTGEPPDKSHDWVLRVSREGRKEGMLKSYKFDSRPVPLQEIEQNPQRVPFEIVAPEGDELSLSRPAKFSLKVKRDSRATRSLLVEWMGEVVVEGEGYRVAGTGREGTLEIPRNIVSKFPAVLSLRVGLLNANGKAYALDRVYRLVP